MQKPSELDVGPMATGKRRSGKRRLATGLGSRALGGQALASSSHGHSHTPVREQDVAGADITMQSLQDAKALEKRRG